MRMMTELFIVTLDQAEAVSMDTIVLEAATEIRTVTIPGWREPMSKAGNSDEKKLKLSWRRKLTKEATGRIIKNSPFYPPTPFPLGVYILRGVFLF